MLVGVGHLLWKRHWLRTVIVVAWIAAVPLLLARVSRIEDDHLRLWVAMLTVLLFPAWLLSGFFVDAMARHEWPVFRDSKSMPKRRLAGGALALGGAAFWVYGATHPAMTKTRGVLVLMVALYSLVIGLYWLGTGKRLSD